MAEVKLTLKGETADRLVRLMKEARYPNAEAAVAEALEALESTRSPDLDTWLRDVVGPRLDAMRADPHSSLTPKQVRERLFGKA